MQKKIKSALISVFYKEGLDVLVKELVKLEVKIYSTGGTLSFIESLGLPVTSVDSLTGFPEILGGRVKTLHPKIFGGILARRENLQDLEQLQTHEIPEIDLVIVDLYPFEETLQNTQSTEQEIIEKIDIGGISLIRATAKNFKDTWIISSKNQYEEALKILQEKKGETDLIDRKLFASKAFMISSHYDTQIFNWFNASENLPIFKESKLEAKALRYGENPHQQGRYFGDLAAIFTTLNGKELSYNNLVDVESSLQILNDFEEPTCAVIKHTNTCGLASRETILEAYLAAYASDPTSAFGGVLAVNRKVDLATATAMHTLFFEVLTAPSFDADALELLTQKKNRILLQLKEDFKPAKKMFKSLFNGVLEQDTDLFVDSENNFKTVTQRAPTQAEMQDLIFAIKAVKHLKSNGIAIVKNKQLIGMGCGQTSRVDSLQSALKKMNEFGFSAKGAVMASEAFFPFPDCVNIAHTAGVVAIAQPGGSIKDEDSISAADSNEQSMVMTGVRHFKHG